MYLLFFSALPDCKDASPNCPVWAYGGQCEINPLWMLKNCRQSCNLCGGETIKQDLTKGPNRINIICSRGSPKRLKTGDAWICYKNSQRSVLHPGKEGYLRRRPPAQSSLWVVIQSYIAISRRRWKKRLRDKPLRDVYLRNYSGLGVLEFLITIFKKVADFPLNLFISKQFFL